MPYGDVYPGHGWDVKCVQWHPTRGVIVSGSKDNLIKLWDPKSGQNFATLHGHKNTVIRTLWNKVVLSFIVCTSDKFTEQKLVTDSFARSVDKSL